jgi:hypothetical protein
VYYYQNCYWHHAQLPYGPVGYREQSLDYTLFVSLCLSLHPFCAVLRILVYSGVDYPHEGDFIKYTIMIYCYSPLELVSREDEYVRNQ